MCAVTHSAGFLATRARSRAEASAFRESRSPKEGFALRGFPDPIENPRGRAGRLTPVRGRFLDGAAFVFPDVQLPACLTFYFLAARFLLPQHDRRTRFGSRFTVHGTTV